MAEQRPYRLAGTADGARLTQIKLAALLSLGAAFIAINWIATQRAARTFGYAPALGAPLCDLPIAGLLYRPWDWIV